MPRKVKRNHAVQCKPVGEARCKESRDGRKKPVGVARPCPKCREVRCRMHCACARRGVSRTVRKQKAARSSGTKVVNARQDERSNVVVLPLAQSVEEAGPLVDVLGATAYWDSVSREVAAAKSTVFLGSFCYDNSRLQTQLLAARGRGVAVEVLLDKKSFHSSLAPRAVKRVDKLKEKGAKVYLANGKSYKSVFGRDGQPGNYHAKVLVVDGLVAFVGSANATNNSCVNGELALKVTGKVVAKGVYDKAWSEALRVETY